MRFTHWSDAHGSTAAETSALSVLASCGCPSLYTGDSAFQNIGQGHNTGIDESCLIVLGNHDRQTNVDSNNPTNATNAAVFNAYFAEGYTPSHAELASIENPTYWVARIEGVPVIGLDCTLTSQADIRAECRWLEQQLSSCALASKKAIVISHIMASGHSPHACCMTELWYWRDSGWYTGLDATRRVFAQCINSLDEVLRENAGSIAFCLYGHDHSDGIFLSSGYPEIVIGDTYLGDIRAYNSLNRSAVAGTQDILLMNLYDYDPTAQTLVIWRLGANNCSTGTRRCMAALDLSRNAVVSTFSN